jgi:hypothetical protein
VESKELQRLAKGYRLPKKQTEFTDYFEQGKFISFYFIVFTFTHMYIHCLGHLHPQGFFF